MFILFTEVFFFFSSVVKDLCSSEYNIQAYKHILKTEVMYAEQNNFLETNEFYAKRKRKTGVSPSLVQKSEHHKNKILFIWLH